MILVTWPVPTVRSPSWIEKCMLSAMRVAWASCTVTSVQSPPGITISVPSGKVIVPVT
jgi:hypothetical protein